MSVRENKSLLEQVRTDPLTGLGNRGGMQVDLADPQRAGDRAPSRSTLLLFDLNGFKRYNDTFGHPDGDQLLARLGRQLRAGGRRGRHRLPLRRRRVLRAADLWQRSGSTRRSATRRRRLPQAAGASTSLPPGARRRFPTRRASPPRRCSSPTCGCTRRRSRDGSPTTTTAPRKSRSARWLAQSSGAAAPELR